MLAVHSCHRSTSLMTSHTVCGGASMSTVMLNSFTMVWSLLAPDERRDVAGHRAVERGHVAIHQVLVVAPGGVQILLDRLHDVYRRVGRRKIGAAENVAGAGTDFAVQPDQVHVD